MKSDGNDYTYEEDDSSSSTFNLNELNNLVRDLYLSKDKTELFDSRLKKKHILSPGTTFARYIHSERDLLAYFVKDDDLVYCNNAYGLMTYFGINNESEIHLY
ncbi:UNVERIFIED_CONTAM: hypothetical protein RMT77_008522 [Armadillidium vulgare]